jgi:Transposase zinc-ribbon domain
MKSQTLSGIMTRFKDEGACKAFLQERRWPNGVTCPRCHNAKVR